MMDIFVFWHFSRKKSTHFSVVCEMKRKLSLGRGEGLYKVFLILFFLIQSRASFANCKREREE